MAASNVINKGHGFSTEVWQRKYEKPTSWRSSHQQLSKYRSCWAILRPVSRRSVYVAWPKYHTRWFADAITCDTLRTPVDHFEPVSQDAISVAIGQGRPISVSFMLEIAPAADDALIGIIQ